jgi:group I intron endonuclease
MINLLDKSQFKAIGVYVIYNSNNNKYYVGSSKELVRRYYHHLTTLRSNKHKNYKLQLDYNNTVDKNVFSYSCIEILTNTELLLEKEQEWINFFNSYNDEHGYNINPSTTLISQSLPSEIIAKRRQTFLKTLEEKRKDPEFKGYNTKPNKTSFQVGIKVWNEGIKMSEEQRSKLRVPKTYNSEEERLKRLENVKLTKENKLPVVYIYDLNNNFLQKFNNCWEIEKYSQSNEFKLPIISGVKENKNYLAIQKIKECYNGIRLSYKGLKFSLLPLHQEIDVEKLDNIGENPNILILLG